MKSSSTSDLTSNENAFETSIDNIQVIHAERTKQNLDVQFSQQLKKDGYLLPIGYEDSCQVSTSSSLFPFPVPYDNAFVKSRTDASPNESFDSSTSSPSSSSSSSAAKNHSYINSINEVRQIDFKN